MTPADFLTPREREVAVLVAHGHSNRRIAAELVIATSTAERHVANILGKLNVHSRTEVAAWAVERGMTRAPVGARNEVWRGPSENGSSGYGPTNLPAELSSFIGRKQELQEISALASTTRLLTLTGAGGIGKTRLALRVAAAAIANHPDGVWLVRLDALSDPDLVPAAVASVLKVVEQPGHLLLETLADAIGSRRVLLVLDNCEHLVNACANVAGTLLGASPQLRILATSREPLAISGEQLFWVPPLALPGSFDSDPTTAAAVQLFMERARLVRPDFVLDRHTAPVVVDICIQMDGMPLAVELAAARVNLLSVEQIRERLDDRLPLLTTGNRTGPLRHKTLHAALDWSYALLDEPERHVFESLSVFAGGWDLPAAQAIASSDAVPAGVVLESLAGLVNRSIVIADSPTAGGQVRYRLLETLRQFGRERLDIRGEADTVRARHAEFFLRLAEQSEPELTGPDQASWLVRLEIEHDNERAALRWALDAGRPETALRLASALWRFWRMRGYVTEGQRWLAEALANDHPDLHTERASALTAAGNLCVIGGCRVDEFKRGRAFYEASLVLWRELRDTRGIGRSLHGLAMTARYCGEYQHSEVLAQQALAVFREVDDWHGQAVALNNLGNLAELRGDYARAYQRYEQSLGLYRDFGGPAGVADELASLASLAQKQGQQDRALSLARDLLVCNQDVGDKLMDAMGLEIVALALSDKGRPQTAMRLLGATAALREAAGIPPLESDTQLFEERIAVIRTALGKAKSGRIWAHGQRMPLEQAIGYALNTDELRREDDASLTDRNTAAPIPRIRRKLASRRA